MVNVQAIGWWQLVLVGLICWTGWGCDSANPVENLPIEQISVRLSIDFGGRSENISVDVRIPDKSSVLDALVLAAADADFLVNYRGSGKTAFVTSIGTTGNENAGGANWVYYVNGELAGQSCGSFRLSVDDQVLWKFKTKGLE